jgi:hypothetical protein
MSKELPQSYEAVVARMEELAERERMTLSCGVCGALLVPFECNCPERATGSWVEPTL